MNTENCCRVCLSSEESGYNLQEYYGDSKIYDLIKRICPDISIDNKPDQICNECLGQLNVACAFKQKCETSDLFLKNINFERKFQIFDDPAETIDDFIDTNLFDQDYILDPDYMDPNDDDLKPDFDSLDSKTPVGSGEEKTESKGSQVDFPVGLHFERRKFARNPTRFIKCSSCPETFSGPLKLIQHAKEVHQDAKPFKCSEPGCPKTYQNPKALKVHRKLHEVCRPFKCDECQSSFHVKANLLAHMRIHTGEKFKCNFPNCDKSFSTMSYFKQHQTLHIHGNNIPRPLSCNFDSCDKKFPDRSSLRSHQMVHGEKKFNCEICGNKFRTNQSLKIHHLKHTDIKQFTCHICGVLFKYKNQCYDHVRAHTAKRELECFHCSKKFIKKTLLASHMQTHATVRKFNCTECNKSFKTYNCLYAHRRRHQERVAKFSCASCDKSFTSRSDLTNHLRTHTQEKKFACHIESCSKIFVHKANLNVHIRSHSEQAGFECDLCHKKLANSNALRVHLNKVHKAEKKFDCDFCTLKFASQTLLKLHLSIHKPKQYACSLCNQRYNFAADLNRHMEKMHQDHEMIEEPATILSSKNLVKSKN